jgi:formylglycine-generating enzyme required for sulfatase activity
METECIFRGARKPATLYENQSNANPAMNPKTLQKFCAVLLPLLVAVAVPCQASTITDPGVIILLQDGNASVTWNSAITGPAAIEHSPDLTSDWEPLSQNNTTGSFQHAIGNAAAGFYRVKWIPGTPSADNMIVVQGGTLLTGNSLNGTIVSTFEIGKYEVTWDEWQEVRDWAVENGYTDLAGVGAGSAGDHPVREVNWYDVVKWSNARSEKEERAPVYQLSGAVYRTGQSAPTVNSSADGYRLPTEAEWEWAARGGASSLGYDYSGSNDVNAVAWYRDNSSGAAVSLESGSGTWPVGQKGANELGIHDMSGNVWEWCEDAGFLNGIVRSVRGGSWDDSATTCLVYFQYADAPNVRDRYSGFRLARNSGN